MNAERTQSARSNRKVRAAVGWLEQQLRMQRQLLWHPRVGLLGVRPVPISRTDRIQRRRPG